MRSFFITIILSALLLPLNLNAQQEGKTFTLPEIPSTLRTPAERASYLVAHYWDQFNFTDSIQFMNEPEKIEQAAVDYIDIFRLVPSAEAESSISSLMDKASVTINGFLFFYNTFEKYLYDVESPVRNEQYFIPVLEKVIAFNKLSADDKIRQEMLLKSVSKNKVGSVATDIKYTKADGSQHMLSTLSTQWTVLVFFDPECSDCHMAIQELEKSEIVKQCITNHKLSVLAIYPGKASSMWRTMQAAMPQTWEIAYDKENAIYQNELYDLLGFPTIYLLDKDKKVLLKDVSPKRIAEYLKNNGN